MFIEFPNRLDEIPIKRHSRLCNLERGKQAGSGAVIRQGPPQRGRHPVGMKGAQRVTFTGTDGGHEIVEPYGPVVVGKGQDGSTGTATTDASLDHGMNLEGAAEQYKD